MNTRTPISFGHGSPKARAIRVIIIALLLIAVGAAGGFLTHQNAAQAEGAAVTGVIQDDQGAAVAGAKVTLTSQDFSSSKVTQADGKFEFRNLKPASYRIVVEAQKFRKAVVPITITRPDETLNQPPIQLAGSSLHVTVVDANNLSLRGVTLSLYAKERGAAGSPADRRTTDEGGDAYFGRLAAGSYQLAATLRGYDEHRSDVFISSGYATDLTLQLQVAPVIPINEKAVKRYGLPNLPSKNVQAIYQDSEGWMWFGTDKGVARFNGTDFKSSSVAGTPYEGLAGEDVRSIVEDRNGAMWLATPRAVRRISKAGDDLGAELTDHDARNISVDSRGNIWVATAEGLFKFDGNDFSLFTVSQGLPSNDVRASAEDKGGRIWVATAAGVALIEGDRVVPFEPKVEDSAKDEAEGERRSDERTQRQSPRPRAPSSQRPSESGGGGGNEAISDAQSVFVDAGGTVWLATNKGVLFYDGNRTGSLAVDALRVSSASPAPGATVRAISQDRSGRLWFALERGGVLLYDPARRESQKLGFLDRDHVGSIFTGREGNVWFGTDNGVVHTDFYSFVGFTTSRGLSDNDVRAVVELPPSAGGLAGKLWFLTAAGVSRMEGERFVAVERLPANVSTRAVAFDNAGTIWLATEQGALRFNGQTLTQFNEGNKLPSNNVRWVTATAGGAAIVFATARGAAIFKDGEVRQLDALSGYDARHVFEDGDGRLWFSTSRGAMSFDPKTGEADLIDKGRGLLDNDVRWITRFNDRLLIATREGIQTLAARDHNSPSLAVFDSEPANAMFVDSAGYLWVGTDEGQVKKFATVGSYVVPTVYSDEAYALTSSRVNSFSEDSQRRIWIATDKGAVRHIPVTAQPVARVSLEVDGRSDVPMDRESQTYSVPYGARKLTFHFSAVSMSGQVRYLYRVSLKDGNEGWEVLPVQQGAERDVSRANLGEGAHTFELIALNRDLYGAAAPPVTLSLRVGSPFWKRWWFYALALGLLGLALGAIFTAQRLREREYLLPKELRSYVPIEPNPYLVGNPIRTEKMFYGREDDFRYVRTKLEGVSQGVVIVFCGERRAGKSSILYQVLNGRLGERFIPVFIDLQEMVISSDSEFFARISRVIAESVTRASVRAASTPAESVGALSDRAVTGAASPTVGARSLTLSQANAPLVGVPQFDGRNPYPIFLDFLDDVLAKIGDRTLLIMMDEYELMEGKVDEGKLSAELFTFLAGLMDNKERLALIFTGSRRLEERDKKYWRELLRRSLFRKVGFLSEKDTVRLITDPVEGKVVYGRGVVDVIYRLTAGQPFYTQVICQNTVDYMNEKGQNWLTLADLKHVIADIVDNPLPQMIYTWDGLSDDEKLALSLLAETLSDGNEYAKARNLRASVKSNDYPVNLSENSIRLTLEEMFRRELLEKDATDGFRFKIDLFRLWIRRSHSIWQVVKEVRTL
ncbi:MAG TPA: two-component regulator propeller domain-containing protein [Blastocatellia bacterium]|nr:two-component regulator propeller domain-containing protein [Blastocatellia bacterium]